MTFHKFDLEQKAVHWNELLPGDVFLFKKIDIRSALRVTGRDVTVFFNPRGGADDAMTYVYGSSAGNTVKFRPGHMYVVVSRRIGPVNPYPRDYYVFFGEGMSLEEHLL